MSLPIDPEELLSLAQDFLGRRVLVLGDLMLDRYLWGDTDRISPEAPVPVVEAREESQRLGGAANVAQNIRALGGVPYLVGVCGEDLFGRELVRLLEERDISPVGVVPSRERRTTCKTRILARRQQMLRIDREDRHELPDELIAAVVQKVERGLDEADSCVISDYGKGVITAELLEAILPAARARGVPVAVDPKQEHFFRYLGVSTITPNQLEASAAFGRRIHDTDTLLLAGRALLERLDSESVLVTRGADGMALFRPHEPALSFPAVAHEVYDVTGAGDTVVSVFALALAAGADLSEAAAISNHAAGIVVQEVGTATATTDKLVESIRQNPERWQPTPLSFALGGAVSTPRPEGLDLDEPAGLVSWEEARRRCEALRESGRTVVFTNGCFDLLHAGHVRYLADARELGDLLVVGLNSDDSVQRLKGEGRPWNSAAARATVLLGLRSVDLVIVFDQDTPLELIQHLRPSILCKGADYAPDEVVGRPEVEADGGRLVLIPFVTGFSSSALMARIRETDGTP